MEHSAAELQQITLQVEYNAGRQAGTAVEWGRYLGLSTGFCLLTQTEECRMQQQVAYQNTECTHHRQNTCNEEWYHVHHRSLHDRYHQM